MHEIIRTKPFGILEFFYKNPNDFVLNCSKETDITHSHVIGLVKKWEKEGLLTTEKSGRILKINLTEKGNSIAKHLIKIRSEYNGTEKVKQ